MFAIGSIGRNAEILLQSFGLARFDKILKPKDFKALARQVGCTPRRSRSLTPQVVAWLMMLVALHKESMTQGLLRAWKWVRTICRHLPETCVSEEAFCQARRQLPLTFWKRLWALLRSRYEEQFDAEMRWKGIHRVMAGDGSKVLLPKAKALVQFFGCPKGRRGTSPRPQGRLVAIASVFTGFCLAFKFVALKIGEHTALRHLIRFLKINDLLLLDRGFFSLRRVMAHPAV